MIVEMGQRFGSTFDKTFKQEIALSKGIVQPSECGTPNDNSFR